MPGFKELELHEKFNSITKLSSYLQRNMREFSETYAPYNEYYQALKRQLDALYGANDVGLYSNMSAEDIENLKTMFRTCQEMLLHQQEVMQQWAAANGIDQKVINKANGYFNEINTMITRDKSIVDTFDIRDGLSLPAAVYKNSYEVSNNLPEKEVKFAEYRMIMRTTDTTEAALIDKYLKSSPEKIVRDCINRMEKNPRIYEYVSMPQDAVYAMNTGDPAIINEYLNSHADVLTFSQKTRLNKQLEAMKLADKLQNVAEFFMEAEDEIGDKPKVFRPSDAKEADACELEIEQPKFQTSSQGCWSCGAQLLINSRGNKEVTQEHVREYRAPLTKQQIDEDRNLINRQYNYDSSQNLMNRSDAILAYAPNSMVHELTIQQYLRPEEKAGISPESYLDNSLEVVKKTIKHAITVEHSPVVFRKPGHYITIIGIDGDTIKYKDSQKRPGNTPNQTHTASLKELVANLLINKTVNSRSSVEMTWVSDIKLSKDGKTIHGIPSKYTQMKDDGSLVMPPFEIQIAADDANATGINKKGVRIYRPGGDEDKMLGHNEESVYSDGGIVKFEKVYMPKQLNADYLKKMAEKRSVEDEALLDIQDKEYWGVDHTVPVVRPDLDDNIVNENNVAAPGNNAENVAVQNNNPPQNNVQDNGENEADEQYYQEHYSLSEISTILGNTAEELDSHKISFSITGQYEDYDNLSTELQEIQDLAELGRKSAIKNDGRFGQNEMKRMMDLINGAITTAGSYLDSKYEDMMDDPSRKTDPKKQTREQPRIKAVIGALDKLMDIRNVLSGGADQELKRAEKDGIINNYKAVLVNEADKKKQQEATFKNRSVDADLRERQITEIDALMGLQPEFLDQFKSKNRIKYQTVNGNKVSLFRKIKPINEGFSAIGTDDKSLVLSSKDFAALSFAALTTRDIYEKYDSKYKVWDDNPYLDKESRYRANSTRVVFGLASKLDYEMTKGIDHIVDSRNYTADVMRSYENGNKEPLAKLITEGIKNFKDIALGGDYELYSDLIVYSEMGQRMTAMLDRDPELMKLATSKGITGQDIELIRSMGTFGRIDDLRIKVFNMFSNKRIINDLKLSDTQKEEYYTDLLMGIRIQENAEGIEEGLSDNPEYVREINERDKKAAEISLNALTQFDIDIKEHLEANYSQASFGQLLADHNNLKNAALAEPVEAVRFEKLVDANQTFRTALEEFFKNQQTQFKQYEEGLVNRMIDEINAEGTKRGYDMSLPENHMYRVPIMIDLKKAQMEEKKKQAEKGQLPQEEREGFAREYEDFQIYSRMANSSFKGLGLCKDMERLTPGVGGIMMNYKGHTEKIIALKYKSDNPLMRKMSDPGFYEKERRRIKDYLKGSGISKLKPADFFRLMNTGHKEQGKTFTTSQRRMLSVSASLKAYEKLKPDEKNQLAELYAPLAEVREPELAPRGRNANESKALLNRRMISAFAKNAEKVISQIKGTYGKGKSDSKPSADMKKVANSLKGFRTDMSVEEFEKQLKALDEVVDIYVEKKGFPSKSDRVDRLEFVKNLKIDIADYKNEAESIRKGKGGKIHDIHLGEVTKGNTITVNDLKKNLLSFTHNMMEMSSEGMLPIYLYDPTVPSQLRTEMPPTPKGEFKKFLDAMKDWDKLRKPGPDHQPPKVSFDIMKETVERLNTAATKWLSSHEPYGTDFELERYDFVKTTWEGAQTALRNIRYLQPYMDIVTPEGRMGSLNIYDAVKTMPEPYKNITAVTDEQGSFFYPTAVMQPWNDAKQQLGQDENNFQKKYIKGNKIRNQLATTYANVAIGMIYKYPLHSLDLANADQESLNKRPVNMAGQAAVDMFIRSIDKVDGWAELSKKYTDNDLKDALKEIAKDVAKTKAFRNVVEDSALCDICDNVMEEAKRLGDDKQLKSMVSKENVEKMVKKIQKEKRAQNQAGNQVPGV